MEHGGCFWHAVVLPFPSPCAFNHHHPSFCLQHIVFDYDLNDTGSGSGSGELGVDLEEPCEVEHVMTTELQQVFLPVVYALIFTLGITGNGLVVIVLGCQRR